MVLSNLFELSHKLVCSQSLAGVNIAMTPLFTCGLFCEQVVWDHIILMKVKVLSLILFQMLTFSVL